MTSFYVTLGRRNKKGVALKLLQQPFKFLMSHYEILNSMTFFINFTWKKWIARYYSKLQLPHLTSKSVSYTSSLSVFNFFTTHFVIIYLMLCFYFQAKLLESSHAWLGASTSSIAGKCQWLIMYINSLFVIHCSFVLSALAFMY